MGATNGADFAAKWANRLSGASDDIRKGVNNVSVAPATKAVAKQNKLLANFTAAVQSGKWARNLSKVTLEEWKQKMIDLGLPRVASGANAAIPKMAAFGDKLIAYQNTGITKIQTMPDTNREENRARMNAWFDHMSNFKP